MISESFWFMFMRTGDIRWYLLYREELAEEIPTNEDCGGNPAG